MFYNKKRKRVSISFKDEKKITQDYYKDECDLNKVFKRYRDINAVSQMYDASGMQYGDFTQVTDYREALERIKEAEEVFYQMPAKAREVFGSIAGFLDAFNSEAHRPILTELGFLRQTSSQDTQQDPVSAGA